MKNLSIKNYKYKESRKKNPEKACVGGSIPSLATTSEIPEMALAPAEGLLAF